MNRLCRSFYLFLLLYLHHQTAIGLSSERDVLLEFKKKHVGKLRDWNEKEDNPCGWSGVACQNGVNVSNLNLEGMSLGGVLPAALGSLRSLESLNLEDNLLSGTIPDLSGLQKLKDVRLARNDLSGTLRAALTSLHLQSLEHLDLSVNRFSGHIPVELSEARHLKNLLLDSNNISGSIPGSISQLRSLESLILTDNHLSGAIPHLSGLQKLKDVRLAGNDLSGTLRAALTSLHLQSLEYLDLSVNRFSGAIPVDISGASRLRNLLLYSNEISGSIPGSISQLRSLESLNLYNNSVSGTVSSLEGLQNLTELDLRGNQLSGEITDLENLTRLERLYLGHNNFSGRVPAFERLKNLLFLGIPGNQLGGEIPSEIASIPGLQVLDLSQNVLDGEISPAFANLSNLQTFNLSFNSLSGPIPAEIASMSNLQELNFLSNCLSGSIPAEMGSMSSLETLNLANNNLSGGIPSGVWEMPNLEVLNLASNCLGGEIYGDTWTESLVRVDLSGNRLTGGFPSEMLHDQLKYLNLSGNFLNGSLDISNGDATLKLDDRNLETLDLSNNRLQGDIARTSLEKLSRLKELRLTNNGFWGDIQVEHRIWPMLQVLDVSHNALNLSFGSGRNTLQIIFDTYTNLGELRLSNNNVTGRMPTSTSKLQLLEVLDLSNSNLAGNFTEAFPVFTQAYLGALRFVNLSNNGLWGEIPPGFSDMLNLTHLDLSNNNLSGPLPNLPRLVPNVNFLFFGNPRLCGNLTPTACPRPGKKPVQLSLAQVLAVVGASVIMSAGSFLLLAWRWRIYSKRHRQDADLIAQLLDRDTATTLMSLQDLRRATNNFSECCQIGEGGFGLVYKGVLKDGTNVAIKRSKLEATAEHKLQFLNEVKILSQVHHRNLVKLLGCCLEKKIALLVFEYVSNGNLEEHLRWTKPRPDLDVPLSWRQRLKIAVQTADALTYLHSSASPPIFHLDVKSANVLLDENLNAKVTDFGVSRLAPALDATHITAPKVQGTIGYMDPHYFSSYKLTGKSDVFAFGVVLLELISAQAAVDRSRGDKEEAVLSSFATRLFHSGDFHRLIDPALYDTFESEGGYESIWEVGRLAVRCLKGDPSDRPFMREVQSELQALWQQSDSSLNSQSNSCTGLSQFESPLQGTAVFTPLPCQAFNTQPSTQSDGQMKIHSTDYRNVFTM